MGERTEEQQGVEIDLGKLFRVWLARWWIIVLSVVVCSVGMLIYTVRFVTPLYRAEVLIYVNNVKSSDSVDFVSGSNLATSQQLVNTYVNIIRSDRVLEKVIETAHLHYSSASLRGMMSASQVGETELFRVYVINKDPEEAAYIANAVADIAPDEIGEVIKGGSTKVVDYAKVPTARFSPSLVKNAMTGALIGGALALVYLTLQYLLDNRIRSEEDLAAISSLPILGKIPEFSLLGEVSGKSSNTRKEESSAAGQEKEK